MTARMVEHVVASSRRKEREIYVSIYAAAGITERSGNRTGEDARVTGGQLAMAGSMMLRDCRAVYQPFTLHVAPSPTGDAIVDEHLMIGGSCDNWTGRLLVDASFEMKFNLEQDILHNAGQHTVAHEVGHRLGLADTRNHSGPRLMGRAENGLLDEDRHWIHHSVESGLISTAHHRTTWGSEPAFSYAHE